jgi:nitric oxide reductase subunit B
LSQRYRAGPRPPTQGKRELLVSKTWLQVAGLVVIVGFFVLVLLAYRTYQSDPRPGPARLPDLSVRSASIFGHGAYLGPDFTDDYLHRASASVRDQLGGDRSDSARQETIDQFQTNRYGSDTKTLPYSAQQATAFSQLEQHYRDFFSSDTTRYGLRPKPVSDPREIHQLTSFFAWSAWAAATRRPGHNYSYTNNWPPEEQVGNTPSANVIVWSVISLIALLGGIGVLFAAFGRWRMGWQGRDQATLSFRSPGDVALYLFADLRSAPPNFPWADGPERVDAAPSLSMLDRSG